MVKYVNVVATCQYLFCHWNSVRPILMCELRVLKYANVSIIIVRGGQFVLDSMWWNVRSHHRVDFLFLGNGCCPSWGTLQYMLYSCSLNSQYILVWFRFELHIIFWSFLNFTKERHDFFNAHHLSLSVGEW